MRVSCKQPRSCRQAEVVKISRLTTFEMGPLYIIKETNEPRSRRTVAGGWNEERMRCWEKGAARLLLAPAAHHSYVMKVTV